jgi:hypothetical protein
MTHLNEWKKRIGEEKAQQIVTEASGVGTAMHANLERFLVGEQRQPGNNPVHVQANKMADVIITNGLSKMNEVWAMEQSLYFPGLYSGTTDLVGVHEGEPAVCDHKQTNKPKKAEWVEDYYLQLMAYILAHNEVYGISHNRDIFMAVIEIAKIQVRRGQENQTGVPQLAGGEFAWAADTEKLYIGLRRDDGGSRDQNVEILTENHLRNLFNLGLSELNYTYRENSTSTVVAASGITAEDGTNDETIRTIQDKLDDFVSVKDFGVYGDGNPWDLRRLQLAIDRLYLNTGGYALNPARKLHFPAGTYVITGTVFLPARTSIIGDGPGKTVFVIATSTDMFQTCDLSSAGGSTGYRTFDSGAGNGAEFSSTGSARSVQIEDVTMRYHPTATTVTQSLSLLNLDCADNSVIRNVEFLGNLDATTVSITTSSYVGLTIRGKTANGTNNNAIIDNCVFNRLYHGVLSNDDISRTVISNSDFSYLKRGITFNDPKSNAAQIGPRLVKIEHNTFDLIEEQAIYVGSNNASTGSFVTSQNNFFDRVGNYSLTDPDQLGDFATTATAIISFYK